MDEATPNTSTAGTSTSTSPSTGPSNTSALWTTLFAVLLVPLAFVFGALAPMATDSCGPDSCARSLNQTLAVVAVCWFASWTLTPLLVVASWLFPSRPRYAWVRWYAGRVALVPPVIVILLVWTL